jgi:hypothetical protein
MLFNSQMNIHGIPSLILINGGYDRYLILSIRTVRNDCLKTTILENPKQLVLTGRWREDGVEKMPVTCKHQRLSCEGTLEYYSNTMTQTSRYLSVPWHGNIPVYTMTSPNLVLPVEFYSVYTGKDRACRWHFIGAEFSLNSVPASASAPPSETTTRILAPSASPSAPASQTTTRIPAHIFKAFVETAISKKETCSITMDELELGNVGMTPCGHLFDKNALTTALNISKKCPQCRAPAMVSQIQS